MIELIRRAVLQAVVLDRPPVGLQNNADWAFLARKVSTAVLVADDDVVAWRDRLPTETCIVPYASEESATLTSAVTALQAAEGRLICISACPGMVTAAQRMGLIGASVGWRFGDDLGDVFFPDLERALETFRRVLSSDSTTGWLGEVETYRDERGRQPKGRVGAILHGALPGGIGLSGRFEAPLDVAILGRYYVDGDSRHDRHQYSARILKAKNGDRAGYALLPAIARGFVETNDVTRYDLITRVPPKKSQSSDPLGDLVFLAARRHSDTTGSRICEAIMLDAVRCVGDHAPQKEQLSWSQRMTNVAGAFHAASCVAGRSVLVVDDIITSGATAASVADALRAAQARHVTFLALALTQRNDAETGRTLYCPRFECDGRLVMRFKKRGEGVFWGCSRWRVGGGGCPVSLAYEEGLAAGDRVT